MAGRQSFSKRVLVPLAVIVATVGGLSVMGLSLWNMTSTSATQTNNSAPRPSSSAVNVSEYLPVNVFNGSSVPGLARKMASTLVEQQWVVKKIANWSGEKVQHSTVFYPSDAKDSADALAAQVGAFIKVATGTMSQTELTFVVTQ
jgi:LytR cell envelope-related transcriptional attenuator